MNTKIIRGGNEIGDVVGNDCVGSATNGGLQDQFIIRVVELRTPSVVDRRLVDVPSKKQEESVDLLVRESVNVSVDRTFEDCFVFKEKGRRGNKLKPVLRDETQEVSASPVRAAEGGDEDGCVEDEAYGRRSALRGSGSVHPTLATIRPSRR